MQKQRKWYSLHRTTYFFALLFIAAHILVAVPGSRFVMFNDLRDCNVESYQHGWPFVHMAKLEQKYIGGGFFKSEEFHQRTLNDTLFGKFGIHTYGVIDPNKILVPATRLELINYYPVEPEILGFWSNHRAWNYVNQKNSAYSYSYRWFLAGLIANIFVFIAMLGLIVASIEFLRRKIRRFNLRFLMIVFSVVILFFGWIDHVRTASYMHARAGKRLIERAKSIKSLDPDNFYLELGENPNGYPHRSVWYQDWIKRLCDGSFDVMDRNPALPLESLDRLPYWNEFDSLTIYSTKTADLSPLYALLEDPWLRSINSHVVSLAKDVDKALLDHLPVNKTKSLTLYGSTESCLTIDRSNLSRFRNLEFLELIGLKLKGEPPNLPNLRQIYIDGGGPNTGNWLRAFKQIEDFCGYPENLQFLNARKIKVMKVFYAHSGVDLTRFENLKEIEITFKDQTGIKFPDKMPQGKQLERVEISFYHFDPEFMAAFFAWLNSFEQVPNWKTYILNSNSNYRSSKEYLALLKKYPRLTLDK